MFLVPVWTAYIYMYVYTNIPIYGNILDCNRYSLLVSLDMIRFYCWWGSGWWIGMVENLPGLSICPCVHLSKKKYLSIDPSVHTKFCLATQIKTRNGAEFQLLTLYSSQINAGPSKKSTTGSCSHFQDKYQELRERESRELVGEVPSGKENKWGWPRCSFPR